MLGDYTPYQQKIIKRFYNNQDTIQRQRLAELVTELFLADGKKRERAWKTAAAAMQKLGVPQARIDHLRQQDNPALIAEVVKELEARSDLIHLHLHTGFTVFGEEQKRRAILTNLQPKACLRLLIFQR